MSAARSLAERGGRPAGILTFDPHPRTVLRPAEPLFALASPETKARLVAAAGMRLLVSLTFDAALMATPAEAFVADILVGRLGISGAVVGAGFRYGKARGGDAATLAAAGRRHGFAVQVVDHVLHDGRAVSSSAIRQALADGDVRLAEAMLGRPWTVTAPVAHGDKRGRLLGFPTANMILDPGIRLRHGIYAVRADVAGRRLDGVASFGRRPTFDDGAPRLETFLFDFAGDLYGEEMTVSFVAFLRGEEKFDTVEALVIQMDRDVRAARTALAAPRQEAG
jgi:riboflavin kinase/FMN adenylyltransferase